MTLPDFLLARIAEDEAEAQKGALRAGVGTGPRYRIVAECGARRRIVELHDGVLKRELAARDASALGADLMHGDVLRLLALPYADHPDYRQEWRP